VKSCRREAVTEDNKLEKYSEITADVGTECGTVSEQPRGFALLGGRGGG
jgi:hypothetical protein